MKSVLKPLLKSGSKLILGLLSVLAVASCSQEPTVVETYMQDSAAVARGEALFTGTCSGYCHSLTPDSGDALFLFDCSWKHGGTDQNIFDTVTNGVPNTRMLGFGNNFPEGEADLWKIIAYLRTNAQGCA